MNNNLLEKVSYLKGLCDGANLSKDTKEGLLIHSIIKVLEEFADKITDIEEQQIYLEDSVDSIDESLSDLEDHIYEDENEEEMLVCPSCGEEVFIDEDSLYNEEDEIYCPVCDEVILPSINSESDFNKNFSVED